MDFTFENRPNFLGIKLLDKKGNIYLKTQVLATKSVY